MKISAEFIVSAAGPGDLPRDGLPQIAMVGRSNVGKSSLINALTRQRVARTSAAPGKTRLANVYRVQRGASAPFYLVDLPGYGYARGGAAAAREFAALTDAFFRHDEETGSGRRTARREERDRMPAPARQVRQKRVEEPTRQDRPDAGDSSVLDSPVRPVSALLLVDARHPGLESDRAAWQWLHRTAPAAVVGTKIDKLARNQRMRALRQLESAFEDTVLPVSSVTGEGLDELWKLIDRLANSRHP